MPFIKISGLTTATAVSATNQFEINQNGGSRSATVAQVAAFARTSATDPVVLPAGTVSAPALTFTGDTNTGIYSPAADTIAFSEGGVEAMRIDASGNVGIGQTAPGTYGKLEVRGAGYVGAAVQSSDASGVVGVLAANSSSELRVAAVTNHPLTLLTNNLERMRIDASGNVGIGVSAPIARFTVVGGAAQISPGTTAQEGVRIQRASGVCSFTGINHDNNAYNALSFAAGGSEAIRIATNGFVGFGTSSPDQIITTNSASTGVNSLVSYKQAGTTYGYSGMGSDNRLRLDGIGVDVGLGTSGANYAFFYTSGSERMRITAAGNVGIGTGAPVARLQVEAGAGVTPFYARGANAGIYVDFAGTGGSYYDADLHVFRNGSTATEYMRINSSGNVGIGTSSPEGRLQANASSAFQPAIIARSDASAANWARMDWKNHNVAATGIIYLDQGGEFAIRNDGAAPITFYTNGANERARITSGGEFLIGTATATSSSRLKVKGSGTTGSTTSFNVYNSADTELCVIADNGVFYTGKATFSPYNNTTGSAANVFVGANGDLFRSTSSLKYKKDVVNYDKGLSDLIKLRPVYYKDNRTDAHRLDDNGKTYAGLIAEEVESSGFSEFVQYAEDGTPDALAYGNMVALCIKAIQELKAENDALKARVAALENK